MAGRAMAKPATATPVVPAEEQAKNAPTGDATVPPAGTPLTDEEKARVAAAEAANEQTAPPAPPAPTPKPAKTKEPKHRFEEFDATRPDGKVVHIRRNIDTGEQEVTEK